MSSYYRTPHWKQFSQQAKDFGGNHCEDCGIDEDEARRTGNYLQVHHKNYNNVGNEDLDDVVTLCKRCHGERHGRRL